MLQPAYRSRVPAVHAALLLCALLAGACAKEPPPAPAPAAAPATTAAPVQAEAPRAASFINKVWAVSQSSTVAPGQLYVFLSEGTLVIASPTGMPSLGRWREEGGELQMIEEGQPAQVDVLNLTATEFRIRINGPGEPIDMTLVPGPTTAKAAP